MSARLGQSVIPVLPLADYDVSVKVRLDAEPLRSQDCRMAARYSGPADSCQPRCRRTLRTDGAWKDLTVHVPGNFDNAADLALELQVAQPRELGEHAAEGSPMLQDVQGHAWFDDLSVHHSPRISLKLENGTGVIELPQVPRISMVVRDVTNLPLTTHLRIYDLNGQCVHSSSLPAPRGRQTGTMEIPVQTCGWYHATLEVASEESLVGHASLDYLLVPAPQRPLDDEDRRFGVIIPDSQAGQLERVPELLRILRAGSAVVPGLERVHTPRCSRDRSPGLRQMVEQLLRQEVELTFARRQRAGRSCAVAQHPP